MSQRTIIITTAAAGIIDRCIEESEGNRLAAVERAYTYTWDAYGWDVILHVLHGINQHFGPDEQVIGRLLLQGEHATIVRNNWRGELMSDPARRFEVYETRPYRFDGENGCCQWPSRLTLSYLEPRKRKSWQEDFFTPLNGMFVLIERGGKTLFDSREYPLFKELARLRTQRERAGSGAREL
jgi:hypothetical protein